MSNLSCFIFPRKCNKQRKKKSTADSSHELKNLTLTVQSGRLLKHWIKCVLLLYSTTTIVVRSSKRSTLRKKVFFPAFSIKMQLWLCVNLQMARKCQRLVTFFGYFEKTSDKSLNVKEPLLSRYFCIISAAVVCRVFNLIQDRKLFLFQSGGLILISSTIKSLHNYAKCDFSHYINPYTIVEMKQCQIDYYAHYVTAFVFSVNLYQCQFLWIFVNFLATFFDFFSCRISLQSVISYIVVEVLLQCTWGGLEFDDFKFDFSALTVLEVDGSSDSVQFNLWKMRDNG